MDGDEICKSKLRFKINSFYHLSTTAIAMGGMMVNKCIKVARQIFEKSDLFGHYNVMMGDDFEEIT